MNETAARRRHPVRALRGGIICTTATAGLVALGAAPAQAHAPLIDNEPSSGAAVTAAPADVRLVFGGNVLGFGARVRVTGAGGTVVSTAPLQVSGPTVRQPLGPDLPPGIYTVVWRVPAADGDPSSGIFTFTVTGAGGLPDGSASGSRPPVAATLARADDGPGSTGWALAAGIASGIGLALARGSRRTAQDTEADLR